MDTPEKTQIGTPLSKFEDSPVFRYINNLSPIKPVKSVPITQTFNSLSFASLPSVFTSPHVSSHRESRFFRKHTSADPSKPESSSEDQNKVESNGGIVEDAGQLYDNSAKLQENFHPGVSIGEASMDSPTEHLKYVIELPQTLKYECGSPDCDRVPCVKETDGVPVSAGTSASIVPFAQEDSERGSSEDGPELQRTCHIEAKSEATGCDWESLISDSSDILIFSSPNDSEAFRGLIQKSVEPPTRFCSPLMSRFSQNDTDWVPKMHTNDIVGFSQQHEDLPEGTAEARQQRENQIQENIGNGNGSKCMDRSLSGKENNELGTCLPYSCEPISNLNRGMRRRCLDFETLAARRKSLGDGFISSSTEKQAVPVKPSGDSSRCVLPGIGLHLNALALTLKDSTNVKPEILPSARQQLGLPSSAASYSSLMIVQEPLHESLSSAPTKSETEPAEEGAQHAEDASQASAYLVSEDFNQNSPRKKRRRSEHAGEGEACKRCNCKKSKCLKLYCECFAAGVYCIEPCSCLDCFNKPIHEDTVLATRKQIESRNPLAFAPKVIRNSDSVPETGDDSSKTPASARHKRGCNCKKSSCLKKYCECYQGGVGCSINCRCEGCKNAFGRKDGSVLMGTEVEPVEETETYEKSEMDKALQKSEILNDEEQNANSALPTTPLPLYRPLVQLPFSSKSKPPRSLLAIGSSSGFYNDQKFGKPNILRAQPKFEKSFQTVTEDEMPEILRGNCSPSTRIKTASPNNKRVSPPHCDLGSTPGRRSGRKLILQSIPSFPSLTPQH